MHTAVAVQGIDAQTVQAVLTDWRTAPVNAKIRAALGFLQKLTLYPTDVTPADIEPMRAAGVSDQAIEDAVQVCYIFSVLTRLADAFDFDLTTSRRWRVGGRIFHWFGYGATSLPG